MTQNLGTFPKGSIVQVSILFEENTGTIAAPVWTPADPTNPRYRYKDGNGILTDNQTPTPDPANRPGGYIASIDTATGSPTGRTTETWAVEGYSPDGDSVQAAQPATFTVDNTGLFL